ncbi:lysozyme inhibitor LprI family protein [Salinisphaera sp. T31B1]|uniref:lysozyme inhibitor LprI family protein n=1 Tax=Salinisphaera sp. T31B1 TaxID=727963 RepID=UPI00333E8D5F
MKYLFVALLCFASVAQAVDNPDRPDHLGAFHERMTPYEQRIRAAQTTADMSQASTDMASALDDELNTAYKRLMAELSPEQQSALRTAQRHWLAYRDAEFAFLNDVFTRESHGTSVVLTVGGARNALVYERAEELWSYLQQL